MNTVQMQNLLSYINGLSLTTNNRRWLAEHLYAPLDKKQVKDYYESEEFLRDIDDAESDILHGKGLVVNDLDDLFA